MARTLFGQDAEVEYCGNITYENEIRTIYRTFNDSLTKGIRPDQYILINIDLQMTQPGQIYGSLAKFLREGRSLNVFLTR